MADAAFPAGCCAVTTYGQLQMETCSSLLEMRGFSERAGIAANWVFIPGMLVDRARNDAVRQFLAAQPRLEWLLFVDGDCVFKPDALLRLLTFAYRDLPVADVVGAYNPLRGSPYLPTIDTGTGTWESHLPMSGPVEVMRTGSAFILWKRHVFEAMAAPWYGTRNPMRPIDAMAEVDNWALQRFDGKNPLREHPAWNVLFKCATDDPATHRPADPLAFVGEDSATTDRARFLGFKIFVLTDVDAQHVDRKIISAADHRAAMKDMAQNRLAACGVKR